jgi:hypothetical protein
MPRYRSDDTDLVLMRMPDVAARLIHHMLIERPAANEMVW